jgi:DNA-binding MarR family transcriptional regulator
VHPTSVTNTVDRLEAAGLVARELHPGDRRATLVALTRAGRDLAAQATAALNDAVFAAPGLTADDVEDLVAIVA